MLGHYLGHQGFLQELLLDDEIRNMKWFKKYDEIADKVEYLKNNFRASAARDRSHIVVSMTSSDAKEDHSDVAFSQFSSWGEYGRPFR